MCTSKPKKFLSLLLSVVMILTMVPATVFTFAADPVYPTMEAYTAASSGDYHAYYNKVYSVTFLDKIDYDAISAGDTVGAWDVSADDDGSVMAWMKKNVEQTATAGADRYDVYIAGEGGVGANPKSNHIFFAFSALEKVNGLEHFRTGNATTFESMFMSCSSLKEIDLSMFDASSLTSMRLMFKSCSKLTKVNMAGMDTSNVTTLYELFGDCRALVDVDLSDWDTGNVTTLENMFKNCESLTELDLGSFNTSKVTTMRFMFYLCRNLETIYVGDGWTTESIANLYDGVFNCCYAKLGGQEEYDKNPNPPISAHYARLEEEGGYLTHVSEKPQPEVKKYTVTYTFTGDVIPEGVSVAPATEYNEGTTVTVVSAPSAEGYEFSGWSTEDADITNGSFVIENDVNIVGSWSKLYNVNYVYTGYVPEGAPTPGSYSFKAGDGVTVDPVPFVDGYVFVGWTTEDVAATDGMFTMPEKDVTLYGYFKKPVESVEINGGDIVLNKDDKTVVNVIVKPEDATVKDLVYESSDETVVTVDDNGEITAIGEGTAIITVYSKDDPTKSDTITVTVKFPVTDIRVEETEITLNKGTSDKIEVTVTPDEATNKEVTYKSDDETVAKVDENGNITAIGEGTTTITVTSKDDPTVTETITVTVKNPVTELTVTDDFTLDVGESKNVEAIVNEDATNKELIYESSDPSVAKVDEEGNVLAVGEGTTTITVTSKDDPTITETITVTVKVPVEDIVVEENEFTLDIGETDKIEVTVTPDDATNKEVTYKSDDETVAKVDENGNIIAIGEGTTTITVTSKDDPTVKETITVTVKVPVEDIVVEENEFTLDIGETEKIEVTVTPDDATNKEVTYKSDDETVAKVDENGNITAIGEGTTTITVTSKDDPTVKETIIVTVKGGNTDEPDEPDTPDYVIEAPESITVIVGLTQNIGVKVTPEGYLKPTYTSSDETIVTVDADGNITAHAVGMANITVDFGNGEIIVIPVIVIAIPTPPRKHHICFGKTDGIGWYEVSVNGGDFFPQGPNSTLEVEEGSVLVVRVQDMWIDDEFDFYVNGKRMESVANTITVVVDGYMLIGALSMDVDVPDVEESLSLFERIIKIIRDIFDMIASWFKK